MAKHFYTSLKFIAFVLSVLILIDWLCSFGIKKNSIGIFYKPLKICTKNNIPAIAVFGSSVGEMGVDCNVLEEKTNLTAYNFSFNGTRFSLYNGLINEIKDNNESKLVVLCETYFSFEKIDAVTNIERFLPCIQNENVYKSLYEMQPYLAFKCRYVPFYKYVTVTGNYYWQSLIGLRNYLTKRPFIDSLKGQTRVYRGWEKDQDSVWARATKITVNIDSQIVNTYIKTIRNLKNANK